MRGLVLQRAAFGGSGVGDEAVDLTPFVIFRQVLRDRHALLVYEQEAVAVFVDLHFVAGADPAPELRLGLLVLVEVARTERLAELIHMGRQALDHGLRDGRGRMKGRPALLRETLCELPHLVETGLGWFRHGRWPLRCAACVLVRREPRSLQAKCPPLQSLPFPPGAGPQEHGEPRQMAFSEDSLRDRLTRHLAASLDAAHVALLMAEIERLGLVPAVTALVQELEDLSPKAARAVIEALPELHRRAGLDDLSSWLDLAVGMAESSGASALKYAKESPLLLGLISSRDDRVRVLTMGLELAERDPGMTLEFLRVAPELVGLMPHEQMVKWVDHGLELSDVNYVLGGEFFRESPKIAKIMEVEDLRSWTGLGLKLVTINQFGKPDYMATLEFFRTTPALLEEISAARTADFFSTSFFDR